MENREPDVEFEMPSTEPRVPDVDLNLPSFVSTPEHIQELDLSAIRSRSSRRTLTPPPSGCSS